LLRDKVICAGIEAENKEICVHLSQLWVECYAGQFIIPFCVMSLGGSEFFKMGGGGGGNVAGLS